MQPDLPSLLDSLQENRLFVLRTPFGGDRLLLDAFTGSEEVSRSFRFHLRLLSREGDLDPAVVLGRTVSLEVRGPHPRWFHGHVFRFRRTGQDGGTHFYEAELGPWTDFLRRRTDCRVLHEATLGELLGTLFSTCREHARCRLDPGLAALDVRGPLVQYRETDFDFLSRHLEARGIHYAFEMEAQAHTLVLREDSFRSSRLEGPGRLVHVPGLGDPDPDHLDAWTWERTVVPQGQQVAHFDVDQPTDGAVLEGGPHRDGARPERMCYDYLGEGAYGSTREGETAAERLAQEAQMDACVFEGRCRCPTLAPGRHVHVVSVEEPVDVGRNVFITEVHHEGANNHRNPGGLLYRNRFRAIPRQHRFRPARLTPRPRVPGPQTATVVAPGGAKVGAGDRGHLKVRYHWDRPKGWVWMRMASPLAGAGYGVRFLPRDGQEVVVTFLDGDPDRPLVVGCLHNGSHGDPWSGSPTRGGILTRSAPDGSPDQANALLFEDRLGHEEVRLHAERDLRVEVERERVTGVGGSDFLNVQEAQSVHVALTRQVHTGLCSLHKSGIFDMTAATTVIQDASLVCARFAGAMDLSGTLGNRLQATGQDHTIEVGGHLEAEAGKTLLLKGEERVELRAGKASLVLEHDGTVHLVGTRLDLQGARGVEVRGAKVELNPPGPAAPIAPGHAHHKGEPKTLLAKLIAATTLESVLEIGAQALEAFVTASGSELEAMAQAGDKVPSGASAGGGTELFGTHKPDAGLLEALTGFMLAGGALGKAVQGRFTPGDLPLLAGGAILCGMGIKERVEHEREAGGGGHASGHAADTGHKGAHAAGAEHQGAHGADTGHQGAHADEKLSGGAAPGHAEGRS